MLLRGTGLSSALLFIVRRSVSFSLRIVITERVILHNVNVSIARRRIVFNVPVLGTNVLVRIWPLQ